MKKNKWFGLALVATMTGASFSACSNEAEEVLAQESEIRLTSEITPSRVTSDLQSTQIAEDQEIGVTITGSKSGDDYVNKLWTSDGDGGLSTTHSVYWANTDINVIAYHPYNEEWTSGTKTFTVSNDQSDEDNYLNSDLLFASKNDVAKTENAISLTFSHKLAKINVTLQPEYQEMDLSSAVISICNTKTSTTINLSDGTVPTEATGDVEEITVGTGSTASAIVAPQTVASGTRFIKVVLGSKTFYYTLPAAKQLTSGYSHNYTLTVKETALEIANSSVIENWEPDNDESNIGDAEEVNENGITTIPSNQIWYTSTDENVVTPYVNNTFGITITSNTYKNGKGVIIFDGDVVSIGQSMFSACTSLKDITIPNSVRTIFPQAFAICSSLTNITIPNSVTSIGNLAFENCSSLTNITIPYNVTQIDDMTFIGCNSLESIVVENDNTVYDSRDNCNAIIKTESNKLIAGCKTTTIPDNVEVIGVGAFKDCTFLTNITIPNSVTSIGDLAFYNCVSLSTVNIEATEPPTLGNNAFYAVASSLKINVPASSVNAYKTAEGWSTYADKIYAQQ